MVMAFADPANICNCMRHKYYLSFKDGIFRSPTHSSRFRQGISFCMDSLLVDDTDYLNDTHYLTLGFDTDTISILAQLSLSFIIPTPFL